VARLYGPHPIKSRSITLNGYLLVVLLTVLVDWLAGLRCLLVQLLVRRGLWPLSVEEFYISDNVVGSLVPIELRVRRPFPRSLLRCRAGCKVPPRTFGRRSRRGWRRAGRCGAERSNA